MFSHGHGHVFNGNGLLFFYPLRLTIEGLCYALPVLRSPTRRDIGGCALPARHRHDAMRGSARLTPRASHLTVKKVRGDEISGRKKSGRIQQRPLWPLYDTFAEVF